MAGIGIGGFCALAIVYVENAQKKPPTRISGGRFENNPKRLSIYIKISPSEPAAEIRA